MRHLLRSVLALSVVILPLAVAHADTFSGTATFSDTSQSRNNDFNFTGAFAPTTFSFSGGVGATTTDKLTITVGNVNCSFFNPCGGSTTDNLSVTVAFTDPNAVSGGFNGTGDDYFTFFGGIENNDINWTNNTQVVSFTDGSSVQLSLPDFTVVNGIFGDSDSENLTIKVLSVPSAATPEPSSLMLLGTGLIGGVGVMRRRFGR